MALLGSLILLDFTVVLVDISTNPLTSTILFVSNKLIVHHSQVEILDGDLVQLFNLALDQEVLFGQHLLLLRDWVLTYLL